MPNEEKCSSTNPAFSGTARYRGYSRGAAAGERPADRVLSSRSPDAEKSRLAAFQQGLQESGYLEGKNVLIEQRHWGESSIGSLVAAWLNHCVEAVPRGYQRYRQEELVT